MSDEQNQEEITYARIPRKTRDIEEIELASFIRTYGKFHIVKDRVAARLIDSEHHPYAQKFRLYREATKAMLRALDEVSVMMEHLPASYRLEITSSRGRESINRQGMRTLEGKDYETIAFNHYSQMLFDALNGLKTFVPGQFHDMMLGQLAPFLKTMIAVSSFERAVNPKPKLPQFTIPQGLLGI